MGLRLFMGNVGLLDTLMPAMFVFLLLSIDDTLQVKITDNALSRDLFPMDYHCLGDNENRPVRWMALESLVNNEFSSASDVVSTEPRCQQHAVILSF